MSPVDVVIILAVAAIVALCVRRLLKGEAGGCSDCASGASCTARKTGRGSCKAAADMVARADAALSGRPDSHDGK